MVFMNKSCGEWMAAKKIGIFRSASYKNHLVYERMENDASISTLDPNTQRVIKNWNNITGQYVIYGNNAMLDHEIMNTKTYIHITSPIRRLVDLLNMFWISREMGILHNTSSESLEFFCVWITKIEYINDSMRAIRKIQTDCDLLHRCFTNPEIMRRVYEGTIFGKIVKNDGSILYMVYLEELGLLSRINTHKNIANYTRESFKIYLFEDEEKLKKKIRLQLCENEFSK
jgi:exoribonuclease R